MLFRSEYDEWLLLSIVGIFRLTKCIVGMGGRSIGYAEGIGFAGEIWGICSEYWIFGGVFIVLGF